MSAPSDRDALAALATLRAWLGIGSPTAPAVFDQAHLPAGVSRDAYLRLHRARSRERAEGWTRRGKARLVTAAAWDAEVARETSRTSRPRTKDPQTLVSGRGPKTSLVANDTPPRDVDGDLDRALGIKTKRGATG